MCLLDLSYLETLLQTGLDHMMIVLQPEVEASWQAVMNAQVEDLSLTVHLTLTSENASQAGEHLERLAQIGVKQVSLSADDDSVSQALKAARDRLAVLGLELVWNLPAPYSALNPVSLEVAPALVTGAGRGWLYLEPDGDVRPTQGDDNILGNFLNDPWEKVWRGQSTPA
jgi:hypothetical protein